MERGLACEAVVRNALRQAKLVGFLRSAMHRFESRIERGE
jgi:hypothetical protein